MYVCMYVWMFICLNNFRDFYIFKPILFIHKARTMPEVQMEFHKVRLAKLFLCVLFLMLSMLNTK